MSYALGIDLGTTFSAAAVSDHGRTEISSLGYRAPTIPSIIVLREDGEVLIGEAAERRAMVEPLRTAREFKRRLGDPTPILLGGTPYGAEALMARLLRGVYDMVVEQRGDRPASLVISHPANYGPYKIDLLEQMVRMAEVGRASFISEPVAAALHYAERERIDVGEIVAVYDFGGGTFDAALLRKTETGFEPLGQPEGIERLGGIDFDEAVFAHVAQALPAAFSELDPDDPATLTAVARLREECREAKEALSVDTDVTIPVLLPTIQAEVRLTRSEFEEMIGPRIGETISALRRAVRSADVTMDEVARILLVGGSSRIPLVRHRVREATGSEVFVDAHPKHAIALGAAIAAELRLTRPAAAEEMTEPVVIPEDPGPVEPILERASPVDVPEVADQNTDDLPALDPRPDDVPSADEPIAAAPRQGELEPEPEVEPEPPREPVIPWRGPAEVDTEPPPAAVPEAEFAQDTTVTETADRPSEPHSIIDPDLGSADWVPTSSPAASIPADSITSGDVISNRWSDGINLSPPLIAALAAVTLLSAVVVFFVLSMVAG